MDVDLERLMLDLKKEAEKVSMGEAIRQVRVARKWQQNYLATRTGISNSYLCDLEKNRVTPSLKTLQKLGSILTAELPGYDWRFFLNFKFRK